MTYEGATRVRHGKWSRRSFIQATGAGIAAGAVGGAFPSRVKAAEGLRSIGLGVSEINEIQNKATKDLGFTVAGQAMGYGECLTKLLNQNDQWMWCDENGGKVQGPSRYVIMVPAWHNADSIGYNPKATGRPIESWGELLNKEWKGKVALLNASIGTMDCALAIEALGLKKFGDKGNMTKAEIDFLIDYLIPLKKSGHFRAFWENFGQSAIDFSLPSPAKLHRLPDRQSGEHDRYARYDSAKCKGASERIAALRVFRTSRFSAIYTRSNVSR